MRIKLRLYTRDLDLIAIKQNDEFKFSTAIRHALTEYVETGFVSKITVPASSAPVVFKNEQVDITLNEDTLQNVIDWVLSLRPGMRSSAIKAVFRAAIANPVLDAYRSDSTLVIPEGEMQTSATKRKTPVGATLGHDAVVTQDDDKSVAGHSEAIIPEHEEVVKNADGETELNLFESDFFDNY